MADSVTTYSVPLEVEVLVKVKDGSNALSRYVGLTQTEAEAWGVRPHMTLQEVLTWVASLAVNGYDDASRADGFADLDRDTVTMYIDYIGDL